MKNLKDLVGLKFGRLKIIKMLESRSKHLAVICRCDCGKESLKRFDHMKSGKSRSCGCLRRQLTKKRCSTHGKSLSKEYKIYLGIKARTTNPNSHAFPNYGGRGIVMCHRWLGANGFENFLADMGPRPIGYTVERTNNDGNYEPQNCHWASRYEQSRNKRTSARITYKGKTMVIADWAIILKMNPKNLYRRITNGWSINDAFETPIMTQYSRAKKS